MKNIALSLAIIASAVLTACDAPAPKSEQPEVVAVDEECPRADGEPCR